MIKVEGLSRSFGAHVAVDGISFSVKEGERLILLGPSGCGKTTTLRMINRLVEPSSGVVTVNGSNILSRPAAELRRGIGYVLQNYGLFPHYTVAKNIAVVPELLNWDKEHIVRRTRELISQLHLPEDILMKYPAQLSGGQQQRVGLARALAADPPILLMDEPFGALDPVTRTHLRKEFRQMEQLLSKTIIMVTHDIAEAFELAGRICLMDKGKIMQIGSPAELLFSPANDFVKQFLADQRLFLEMQLIKLKDIWGYIGHRDEDPITKPESISADIDFSEALNYFPSSGRGVLKIVHNENREEKRAGFSDLMEAYGKFKSNRGYE